MRQQERGQSEQRQMDVGAMLTDGKVVVEPEEEKNGGGTMGMRKRRAGVRMALF
jgi:hypothetical protein